MTEPATLRMEEVSHCVLCGAPGVPLYENLTDRLFGVPGTFGFSQCLTCRFVWLSPRPVLEDIPKCYTNYFTHEAPAPTEATRTRRPPSAWRQTLRRLILEARYNWPQPDRHKLLRRLAGGLLATAPLLRRRATYDLGALFPPWHGERRLLDVGCGNGSYLAQLKDLGWHVTGVEMDREAAEVAREYRQLAVFVGTLEEARFPEASFDAITMNHVLEHVPDPLALLKQCHHLLAPGGHLLMATPNLDSLGHRFFQQHWCALDPPRHLCLWRTSTVSRVFLDAGFRLLRCSTPTTGARFIYRTSRQIRRFGKATLKGPHTSPATTLFAHVETALHLLFPLLGEEVCVVARKPPAEASWSSHGRTR